MDQVLAGLRSYAAAQHLESGVPGFAYAVVKDDQVVDAQAFGVKDTVSGEPVDLETIFEIGSCSKAFTALLMALAVDEGKVQWQDAVRKHLPDFAMKDRFATRQMQVADLMSQRSGMPGYALLGMGYLDYPSARLVRALRHVQPITSFRSAFAYQNVLFEAARFIVEDAYYSSYAELVQRRIFGPLGMTRTTALPYAGGAVNLARGNVLTENGSLYAVPDDWPYRDFIVRYLAAGGIHSTVLDLAQWIRLQLGKGVYNGQRIVPEQAILATWTPKIEMYLKGDTTNLAYGNGWCFQTNVPAPVIWHNGGTLSMHSIVGFIPAANMGVAVTTNTQSNLVPENLLWKLSHLYYAPQLGFSQAFDVQNSLPLLDMPPAQPAGSPAMEASVPASSIVGTYRSPAYGAARVVRRGERLFMILGPERMRGQLTLKSGRTYSLTMPGWPDEFSEVRFLGRDSRVRAANVALLSEAGVFRRIRGR